jgi:hypothetical protein
LKAAAVLLGVALLACAPSQPSPEPGLSDPQLAGIWQFPGSGVWIRIWPDGRAFQCRTPPSGVPIASGGIVRGRVVFWDEWWPVQAACVEDGKLWLDEGSPDRRWSFARVDVIGSTCAAVAPAP